MQYTTYLQSSSNPPPQHGDASCPVVVGISKYSTHLAPNMTTTISIKSQDCCQVIGVPTVTMTRPPGTASSAFHYDGCEAWQGHVRAAWYTYLVIVLHVLL